MPPICPIWTNTSARGLAIILFPFIGSCEQNNKEVWIRNASPNVQPSLSFHVIVDALCRVHVLQPALILKFESRKGRTVTSRWETIISYFSQPLRGLWLLICCYFQVWIHQCEWMPFFCWRRHVMSRESTYSFQCYSFDSKSKGLMWAVLQSFNTGPRFDDFSGLPWHDIFATWRKDIWIWNCILQGFELSFFFFFGDSASRSIANI